MILSLMEMFFRMLIGHAVADFALQTDWIASNKNRHSIPKGYDPERHGPMQKVWPYVLTSHALIHGGAVYWATGSFGLGVCETIAHWVIDFGKCEKWYGIHTDQFLHILSKVFWALALLIVSMGSVLAELAPLLHS